jgi:hypothetical protein
MAAGAWPMRVALAALIAVAALQSNTAAHIGSPDVFLDGQAGPYRIFVTVRPPHAIPGIADVEVLTTSDDVHEIRIVPLPLTGPGAQFAPVPDVASRSTSSPGSSGDARLFTGHLWMMTAGAWQVRVIVSGDRGPGNLAVPVPTLPKSTLAMSRALGALLAGLMLLLCAGFVAIVATTAREAGLPPGEAPGRSARRRGRIAGAIAGCVVAVAVFYGNSWWSAEAASYARYVYRPLEAVPTVTDGRLRLVLGDPGWLRSRRLDDFVPDHGHLMHLFIVSPELDRLWHLHPSQVATGTFEQRLPDFPEGRYELFGDLVHKTGLSETVTASFETAGLRGGPLTGDDSAFPSPSGGRIVWVRDEQHLQALVTKRLTMFTFRVEDAGGQPARDLELYMGMPGHAVFIRRDRQVFAHVHPSGSAPMAAMEIATPSSTAHAHQDGALPATVSFPYGFPEAGDYRIFVQVKRAGRIETGRFDAHVE